MKLPGGEQLNSDTMENLELALKKSWEEVLQEEDDSHHQEATQHQHQPDGEPPCKHRSISSPSGPCSADGGASTGLTGVGHGVYLAAAVHSYAQHGRFIVPSEVFAVERVGQEGQVRHHYPVRLLHVVQPLREDAGLVAPGPGGPGQLPAPYLQGEGDVDGHRSRHGSKAKERSRVTGGDNSQASRCGPKPRDGDGKRRSSIEASGARVLLSGARGALSITAQKALGAAAAVRRCAPWWLAHLTARAETTSVPQGAVSMGRKLFPSHLVM